MTPDRPVHATAQGDLRASSLRTLFHRCSAGDAQVRETIILYERVEAYVGMGRALRRLSARDQRAFLLWLFGELTQDEIARRIGVSQMQVSRILHKAGMAVTGACGLAGAAVGGGGSAREYVSRVLRPHLTCSAGEPH